MASGSTNHLGLHTWVGSDSFLRTEFNDNWNAIDAAPGVHICTNAGRPTWGAPEVGRLILETDTGFMYIWDGTVFISPLAGDNGTTNVMRTKVYRNSADLYIPANQSFSPTPNTAGTTFVAPPSGIVTIQVSAWMKALSASTAVSYNVKVGAVIGSGTSFYAGDGLNGVEINGADGVNPTIVHASGAVNYHSGLTPGLTDNVTFVHYNSHAVTAEVKWRSVSIVPQP